nr:hypothetical protein [Tanacetum cinerariifolium]
YGLFVNNDDDQEIFHDAIESASKNFIKHHIDSQRDYDKFDVDHNDSEEKEQFVGKLIRKFNKKIVKCQNRVEKANQQSKDFENQNKDLQDKYDVLKNQTTIFEMNNKELNEQLKELIEKNNDLLAQTKLLKEQLQVKHVVIDTNVECHEKYAKLEAERYEYMIRYSAYFDNDKHHRKQIANQQVLFDKIKQTDGETMINSIKNGDQPLPRVTQVSIAGTSSSEQPPLKDKSCDLWDALARHMLGSEYGEQDRKAVVLFEYETFKATEGELLLDTYIRYLQVINDLKKCGYSKDNYVNDAMGSKKKTVVVTSDPLALIAEKTNVSR